MAIPPTSTSTSQPNPVWPAETSTAITPSDTVNLAVVSRAIVASTAGNAALTLQNDVDGTYNVYYLAQGVVYPFRVKRVWNTNTAASGIVALN
jgi:hypothetical protein